MLSIFGLFTLIVPVAFWLEKRRPTNSSATFYAPLGWAETGLLAVVVIHMLLSGDLGRMGYLFAPAFCSALALVFSHWRRLVRS